MLHSSYNSQQYIYTKFHTTIKIAHNTFVLCISRTSVSYQVDKFLVHYFPMCNIHICFLCIHECISMLHFLGFSKYCSSFGMCCRGCFDSSLRGRNICRFGRLSCCCMLKCKYSWRHPKLYHMDS